MSANIYTVPVGAPFLTSLAQALVAGNLPKPGARAPDPLLLPDVTVLLPTRRATRALQDAFLAVTKQRALLMPIIRPISEGDDNLSLFDALAGQASQGPTGLAAQPAVPGLTRTLILMQLVQYWRDAMTKADPSAAKAATPAQSASLAAELAKLIDDVERENRSLAAIADLVPDTYATHWQQTVDFLKIVTAYWPARLAEDGTISAAQRINTMILNEANRIATSPRDAPVIVAGVTGSIPATVELMRAVASKPNGAIVLPGLDLDLDDASWDAIADHHPEHPQFGFKKLLDALSIERKSVTVLPGVNASAEKTARAAVISEAMRPGKTTASWHAFTQQTKAAGKTGDIRSALQGVALIEAPSAQDEAEAVALILREAVETPGKTAALVSPDRILARRVATRLETWGIRVDDSAGRPFAKTVPGTFLSLVMNVARSSFAPAETMSMLKHPLCRLGLKAFDVRRYARALELIAFRTPYIGKGVSGLSAALDRHEEDRLDGARTHMAVQRIWDEDRQGARDLVTRLATAFAAFDALAQTRTPQSLKAIAAAHLSVAEALTQLPEAEQLESGSLTSPLWHGTAGDQANTIFTELLNDATPDISLPVRDYPDLYASLIARENVREHSAVHPRVSIWGPMEARLQQPDVVVLGALNEGTWPEVSETGAWLNRPMRQAIGLPSPEEETGRSALDFTTQLGANQVYLTRAEKVQGVPTVRSRWLMRLDAVLTGLDLKDVLEPKQTWLAWARARDAQFDKKPTPVHAPEPCPPLQLRPKKLSVTTIERWAKNPYEVFAGHILKLKALPILAQPPDQALRGALVHDIMARFAKEHPTTLPTDIKRTLDAIALDVLSRYTGHARIAALWLPRLDRFLTWFADTERERRNRTTRIHAETSGTLVLDRIPGGFTLTARADRIDESEIGLIITDYKTGTLPASGKVKDGRAPQLPLEAAIALGAPGFPSLTGKSVTALRYIRASGGDDMGEEEDVATKDIAALAASVLAGTERLIARYTDETTAYRAVRRPRYNYAYDDYAHLARVAEWSAHVDEGDTS